MRKNLTISLNEKDWEKVRALARSFDQTYSGVFHRLLGACDSTIQDQKQIRKYRTLLAPHADFLIRRAAAFSKAKRRSHPPA